MSSLSQQGVASAGSGEATIVIIRKPRRRRRRHGGAWKVALADFVTAMMALFMVLWLWQSSDETQQAVAAYFQDPDAPAGAGGQSRQSDQGRLSDVAASIRRSLRDMPGLASLSDYIAVSETPEGLRIELLENEGGTFFQTGSPSPTGLGSGALKLIAAELDELPNELVIEGHTDSRPFTARNNYSNWDLSTDRANSARRILIAGGVGARQIVQVRGFADVRLRRPGAPEDPSNRRVSIIVLDR